MTQNGKGRPPLVADRRPPRRGAAPARPKAAAPKARAAKPAPRRRGRGGGGGWRRIPLLGGLIALILALAGAVVRAGWGAVWRLGVVAALILAGAVFYFHSKLPAAHELLDGRSRGSVTMLDANGQPFAWRGETFGGNISVEHLSPNLKNAVVATEDKRFYQHFGISPRGIASAMAINIRAGRGPLEGNGGSTITQQVAKLLCLGVPYDPAQWKSEAEYEADCRVSSVVRKLKEVPFAMAMEWKYTKDEILTIYLSRAYLGAGARGFEAAAQRYFGKSAADVTPAEAAMLAGLLKAPSYYAPTANLERSRERANVIIGLMAEQGYLTAAQARDAREHPARLSEAAAQQAGGAFADWVMESGPAFLTRNTTEDVVIQTTLDPRLQRAAEEGLAFVFENKLKEGSRAQAAIVVMSADGAVRAMVGGRKIGAAGSFNRATQALRQTGSAFKPFIYAAALNQGAHYNDYVVDEPLTINVKGSGPWSPQNYKKGEYMGRVTLTTALKESLNIPAVKISEGVGRANVRKVAEAFGIVSNLADGPALALGTSEATLLEMTGAYAGILNGGSQVRPYGLVSLTLRGDDAPLIGQTGGIGARVISEDASRELIYMMSQVIESGTGGRARLNGREAAGKTGTTSAARDAWFIGFTADYVAGVWMGYDDNSPLSGTTGGGLPAEIWREVMLRVHKGLPARALPMIVPEAAPATPAQTVNASSPGRQPEAPADPIGRLLRSILGN